MNQASPFETISTERKTLGRLGSIAILYDPGNESFQVVLLIWVRHRKKQRNESCLRRRDIW